MYYDKRESYPILDVFYYNSIKNCNFFICISLLCMKGGKCSETQTIIRRHLLRAYARFIPL
ncbi:hypothetical protein BK762_26095 [Bacillus thuringiensis serovar toumanoffi]|nr:hypothetical protein BK762_26095 [Bacillus thuringiensis serovar toumanoffi]